MKNRKASAVVLLSAFAVPLAHALIFLVLLAPRASFAQASKVEGAARALQKRAIEDDYLASEFSKAQDKLEKAVASCGSDKCSVTLRSQLRRDLAVVQVGGQLDREKGIGNFVEALRVDPNLALDSDLRTKDLDAAFAEAKKRAGIGATAGSVVVGAPPMGQPAGDFAHEPAVAQQIRTAIPVYAEYNGEEQLMKVIARYKGFGMPDWKTVELKKTGEKGWSGVLPCVDVQQGTSQYYLQGFNAANDPVAGAGDRNNPYKVKVTRDKVTDPPHLPGQAVPTQCADAGDCPPNFPGCKKPDVVSATVDTSGKDGGEFCEEDTECKSKDCKNAKCAAFEGGGRSFRRVWLGVSASFDYTLVPSADDVCKLYPPSSPTAPLQPANSSGYYCTTTGGSDYPYRPLNATDANANPLGKENDRLAFGAGASDRVSGGGAFGNVRLMASIDYALSVNFLLGARLGYVLNTYPGQAATDDGKSFPPLHLELRGTLLIGKDALLQTVAPFVMLGGGASTFETSVKVSVVETSTGNVRTAKDVNAWHLAGPGFVTFGGGVRLSLAERVAFMVGARANFAFGRSFAPSFGPDVGLAFGF